VAGLGTAIDEPPQTRGFLGVGIERQRDPALGIFEHDGGPPVGTTQRDLAEPHQRHQALLCGAWRND
jgi:hypothetical protein